MVVPVCEAYCKREVVKGRSQVPGYPGLHGETLPKRTAERVRRRGKTKGSMETFTLFHFSPHNVCLFSCFDCLDLSVIS